MNVPFPLQFARRLPKWFRRYVLNLVENPVHGQAAFMDAAELKQHFSAKHKTGLWLSDQYRLSQRESNANIITLGVTGSGKSQGLGYRNVLNMTGSAIITDLSGEYYQHTSGYLAKQGANIQVLNFTDLAQSSRFNPLLRLKNHQEKYFAAQSIAQRLHSANDPLWTDRASELLFLVIHALGEYSQRPGCQAYNTLGNVLWVISNLLSHPNDVSRFFDDALAHDPFSFARYQSILSQDEKILSSIVTTAEASLSLFTDPDVRTLTASDNICLDPQIMREKKTITYLIVPENLTGYYGLLINLFYSAFFNEVFRTDLANIEGHPITLMMDEFPAMGKINNFAMTATTIRKYNICLHMLFQSWSQLEAVYGKVDAESILEGGVGTKIFLPGHWLKTAKWLEESLGYTTVYDSKYGGVAQHTVREPLLSADQIRMLDNEQTIILTGNKKPMTLKIPHAYKTALQTLLAMPPALLPTSDIDPPEQLIPLKALATVNDPGTFSVAPNTVGYAPQPPYATNV